MQKNYLKEIGVTEISGLEYKVYFCLEDGYTYAFKSGDLIPVSWNWTKD